MGDELKNDDADYSAYEEEMAKPLTAMEQLVLFVEHDLEAPCLYDLHHEVLQATAELERLRSELKQARELLRPLARHADNIEKNMDMTDVDPDTHMVAMGIWISDCFRARTFLKEHEDV